MREEPESVLAGQQLAAVDGTVGHRNAARFATEDGLAFEDSDIESTLRQFVRGRESTDASTQDGYCLSHTDLDWSGTLLRRSPG